MSNRRRWLLLSILPLLALGLDFALFQGIFERRQLLAALDATTLFETKLVRLGTTHSVSLNVALESLKDDDSLAYLSRERPNGLVVSIFIDPAPVNGEHVFEGELSRAVRLRLQSISESVHQQVVDFIAGMGQQQAGAVRGVDLRLSEPERARFPVDRLIVVALKRSDAKEDGSVLETALPRVIADAERAGLKALVLPCIGYQWNNKNSPSFNQIFGSVFKALKGSNRPLDLFLSFYSNWRTADVEKAVEAVNVAWTTGEGADAGLLPSLYRGRYRILLLLMTICLLACMRRAQRTVKSFLLIVGAYVGGALGLAGLIERFTRNYPEQLVEITVTTSWVVLALGFPGFVGWDLKDVFSVKKAKTRRRSSATTSDPASHPGDSKVLEGRESALDASLQKRRSSEKKARTKQKQTVAKSRSSNHAGNQHKTDEPRKIPSNAD